MNVKNEIFKSLEEHILKDEKPSLYLNSDEFQSHIKEYPFRVEGNKPVS
ncbi:hypothetical protein ACER0A_013620 [Haloimpatiens sp. FM7315]